MKSYVNYLGICLLASGSQDNQSCGRWLYIIFLFAGAVWILTQKGKRERKIIAFVVVCLAMSILIWREPEPFSVSCLDVGQGDGLVLRTPEGNCFLVDGGSTNKSGVGQYRVFTVSEKSGISQIDGIFISHTDRDHISGVQEILEMAVKKKTEFSKIGMLVSARVGKILLLHGKTETDSKSGRNSSERPFEGRRLPECR